MLTIFLLPHGGGSAASYRSYAAGFPPAVGRVLPVEIPGRGRRAHEACARSIRECAARSLGQIDVSGNYVVHGHCMGALLAFEVIKAIEASGWPRPRFMVVSGRNAPRHANDWLRRVPGLDDRSLFEEVRQHGGIPKGLSFAMAQRFLALLRHDQVMFSSYDAGDVRINVPILVIAGAADVMTNAAALADWRGYTSMGLSIEWLDGGHYAILEQPARVARYVETFSAGCLGGGALTA